MSDLTKFRDKLLEEHRKVDMADKGSPVDLHKRLGEQEAVDGSRKLLERFEDLKHNTNHQLKGAQDLLQRVQDYETALGSFGDWLSEEIQTVNLIESFACTPEGINAELAKAKVT